MMLATWSKHTEHLHRVEVSGNVSIFDNQNNHIAFILI